MVLFCLCSIFRALCWVYVSGSFTFCPCDGPGRRFLLSSHLCPHSCPTILSFFLPSYIPRPLAENPHLPWPGVVPRLYAVLASPTLHSPFLRFTTSRLVWARLSLPLAHSHAQHDLTCVARLPVPASSLFAGPATRSRSRRPSPTSGRSSVSCPTRSTRTCSAGAAVCRSTRSATSTGSLEYRRRSPVSTETLGASPCAGPRTTASASPP